MHPPKTNTPTGDSDPGQKEHDHATYIAPFPALVSSAGKFLQAKLLA